MRTRSPAWRNIAAGAAIALVAIAWMLFGPVQLGGSVFYVVTDGISMQPRYHDGDLVVVRESDNYAIGDIAAYRSERLGRIVLHRIVDQEGSRYVFKGDNNSWIDSDRPESADVLGRAWITIPRGGKVLGWIDEPLKISLVVAIVALAAIGFRDTRGARRPTILGKISGLRDRAGSLARPRSDSGRSMPNWPVAGGIAMACVLLLLSFTAMARPTTHLERRSLPFEHRGSIGYSAEVPRGAVYESTRLSTGQPVYLRLVDEVVFRFDYRLNAPVPQLIKGETSLDAVLSDSTGWRRTISLDGRSSFVGTDASATGTLNLNRVNRMIEGLQEGTGLVEDRYTLTLVPRVEVTGTFAGSSIEEDFSPQMTFQIDPFRIYPLAVENPDDSTQDPFNPTEKGSVEVSRRLQSTMSLGIVDLRVAHARPIFAFGLLLAIAATGFFAFRSGHSPRDENERIRSEHHDLLVPVKSMRKSIKADVVEVGDFASLLKLAHSHEQVILYREDAPSYFVQHGRHVYVYVPNSNGKRSKSARAAAINGTRARAPAKGSSRARSARGKSRR